jgi:uncharacterized membrane protein
MNLAHVHLLVNHFPIVGLVISLGLILFARMSKNEILLRTGLGLLVVSGIFGLATFFTGEPAEHILKSAPAFSKDLAEAHEEAAEVAIWSVVATGLIAAIGFWWSVRKSLVPNALVAIVILLNIVSLVLVGRTANLGGKISHPEIRSGGSTTGVTSDRGDN